MTDCGNVDDNDDDEDEEEDITDGGGVEEDEQADNDGLVASSFVTEVSISSFQGTQR